VGERDDLGFEMDCRVFESGVRLLIDEDRGERTLERLGSRDISRVAVGQKHGAFGAKKPSQASLELFVEGMVARCDTGSGDGEAVTLQGAGNCLEHCRMA
jgi:hypothetical protein